MSRKRGVNVTYSVAQKLTNIPRVGILGDVYDKLRALTREAADIHSRAEVSALLLMADPDVMEAMGLTDRFDYLVIDAEVPQQECTSGGTNMTLEGMDVAVKLLFAKGWPLDWVRGWMHSHPTFSVKPSGIDDTQVEKFMTQWEFPFLVWLIFNLDGDIFCAVDTAGPPFSPMRTSHRDLPLTVHRFESQDAAIWAKEQATEKVTRQQVPKVQTHVGAHQWGGFGGTTRKCETCKVWTSAHTTATCPMRRNLAVNLRVEAPTRPATPAGPAWKPSDAVYEDPGTTLAEIISEFACAELAGLGDLGSTTVDTPAIALDENLEHVMSEDDKKWVQRLQGSGKVGRVCGKELLEVLIMGLEERLWGVDFVRTAVSAVFTGETPESVATATWALYGERSSPETLTRLILQDDPDPPPPGPGEGQPFSRLVTPSGPDSPIEDDPTSYEMVALSDQSIPLGGPDPSVEVGDKVYLSRDYAEAQQHLEKIEQGPKGEDNANRQVATQRHSDR